MVRLIQKSGYIATGRSGGYMKYIATREGVEKLSGNGPARKKQQKLIQKLLRDFPDSKDTFEYRDYKNSPTAENASALIASALDRNAHTFQAGSGYMKYISTRPGVERTGGHGLFSFASSVDLPSALSKLENHEGRVWTIIFSLRREDAARLGYDNAAAWRALLMAHQAEMAEAMKIPPDQLRWYAAFHDAGHHPHIHVMLWSENPKQGFLTKQGIRKIRSKLTNAIFKDELLSLYQKKDVSYKEVTAAARDALGDAIRQMEQVSGDDSAIVEKLLELAQQLESVQGKKVYGYLKKPLKSLVDSIVDELAKQPEVARCYDAWSTLRDELEGYYKDSERIRLPLSQQKEFRAIKNIVVCEAMQLGMELRQLNGETSLNAVIANSVGRLLRQLGNIFREKSLLPTNPQGMRIDSRRRKKLMEKKMALGHKRDDHEPILTY